MILITGASGFIGTALARRLTNQGYKVRGTVRSSSQSNLAVSETVNIGNIDRDTDWSPALEGVDIVIHLASRAHIIKDNIADSITEFRRVNVGGTESLARQCVDRDIKRFIYMSSIGVLGNSTPESPFTEASPVKPGAPYATTKLEAEQLLHDFVGKSNLSPIIIRPPLVYGPGNPGNFFRLFRWVERGIPLPLASIQNRRSFIGIDNLVDFLLHCIETPRADGETFLVSDGEDISTPDLLRKIAGYMHRPSRLFPCPPVVLKALGKLVGAGKSIDKLTDSLCIDSSKARHILNWKPSVSMDEGLRRAVEAYMRNA